MKHQRPGYTTKLVQVVQHSSALAAVAAIALPVIIVLAFILVAISNA